MIAELRRILGKKYSVETNVNSWNIFVGHSYAGFIRFDCTVITLFGWTSYHRQIELKRYDLADPKFSIKQLGNKIKRTFGSTKG